jgi:hypothetical protein
MNLQCQLLLLLLRTAAFVVCCCRDFSNRPLALLAGFLVRYREVLHQWCELGQHR